MKVITKSAAEAIGFLLLINLIGQQLPYSWFTMMAVSLIGLETVRKPLLFSVLVGASIPLVILSDKAFIVQHFSGLHHGTFRDILQFLHAAIYALITGLAFRYPVRITNMIVSRISMISVVLIVSALPNWIGSSLLPGGLPHEILYPLVFNLTFFLIFSEREGYHWWRTFGLLFVASLTVVLLNLWAYTEVISNGLFDQAFYLITLFFQLEVRKRI